MPVFGWQPPQMTTPRAVTMALAQMMTTAQTMWMASSGPFDMFRHYCLFSADSHPRRRHRGPSDAMCWPRWCCLHRLGLRCVFFFIDWLFSTKKTFHYNFRFYLLLAVGLDGESRIGDHISPPDARFWLTAAPDNDIKGRHDGAGPDDDEGPDDDNGPDNVNGSIWALLRLHFIFTFLLTQTTNIYHLLLSTSFERTMLLHCSLFWSNNRTMHLHCSLLFIDQRLDRTMVYHCSLILNYALS